MAYIGTTPTKVVSRQSVVDYRYTATAGQTAFTGADLNNQVLACNPADMDVRLNGVTLDLTDWTATATTLTLAVAATAGDEVTVAVRQTFEVADTYAKTTADDRFVNAAGDTMSGNLTVVSPDNSGSTNIVTAVSNNLGQSVSLTFTGLKSNASAGIGFVVNETTGAMNIDTSGRVTMPYQPVFWAYNSGGTATSSTGFVSFTSTDVNNGGHYNTSNGRFTAPVSGYYEFDGMLLHRTNGYSGSAEWSFTVSGANVSIRGMVYSAAPVANGHIPAYSSMRRWLSAGDYVQMYVNSLSSGHDYYTGERLAHFSGYLIG